MEQFGEEKYFFPEEMLHYPGSDCEDRAALFSLLARRFAGLETVLPDYPDHVAAAVYLGQGAEGDCVEVGSRRYTVCDPSYIGAPVGTHSDYENNVCIPRHSPLRMPAGVLRNQ